MSRASISDLTRALAVAEWEQGVNGETVLTPDWQIQAGKLAKRTAHEIETLGKYAPNEIDNRALLVAIHIIARRLDLADHSSPIPRDVFRFGQIPEPELVPALVALAKALPNGGTQ